MIIDFHAHVQPGSDHGCDSSQTALRQLELARDAGVGGVVAVSHYYPMRDSLEDYLRRRSRAQQKLQDLCSRDNSLPQVFCGSEVTLCQGLDKLDGLPKLCISGTNLLLVEMPSGKWNARLTDTLEQIRSEQGLDILLAHAERYETAQIEQLLREDYPCQLNYEAFARLLGTRKLHKWAEKGWVAALGSDIHGTSIGYKHLSNAQKSLGKQLFEQISQKSHQLMGKVIGKR